MCNITVYALGIILFEMITHFSTISERAGVLNEVTFTRKVPPQNTKLYTVELLENEKKIIEWCISNLVSRPTVQEILSSHLVPQMNKEEILKPFFTTKYEDFEMFELSSLPLVVDGSDRSSGQKFFFHEDVVRALKLNFLLHGAVPFNLPSVFLPSTDQLSGLTHSERIVPFITQVLILLNFYFQNIFEFFHLIFLEKRAQSCRIVLLIWFFLSRDTWRD